MPSDTPAPPAEPSNDALIENVVRTTAAIPVLAPREFQDGAKQAQAGAVTALRARLDTLTKEEVRLTGIYREAVQSSHRWQERAIKAESALAACGAAQPRHECYWDAADREHGFEDLDEHMEYLDYGAVAEIEHVAVTKREFHVWLEPEEDQDDPWKFVGATLDEAVAARDAEIARRALANKEAPTDV